MNFNRIFGRSSYGRKEYADRKETRAFSSLRHRDFRLLWIGTILSHIGDELQLISVSWLVMLITNSPVLMGVANVFQGLPRLFFGILGGLIADRQNRRTLLIIYTTCQTILAFFFAFLVLSGKIQFWHILVLLPLFGFFNAVYSICRQVYVYDIVGKDDLMNSLAVQSSGMNLANIIGPSIAGILIAVWGVGWCILINAISFIPILISIFMMSPLPDQPKKAASKKSALSDLGDAFAYLKKDTTILLLFLVSFSFFTFGLQVQIIMPLFARDVLHMGAQGYGFLIAAMGAGAMFSGVTMASIGDIRRKGHYLLLASFAYGMLLILFSLSHWFYLSLSIIFFVGAMDMLAKTVNQTLIQLLVLNELRGRVMGIYTLSKGFKPLGGFLMGAGASLFGAPLALSIGAGLCMFVALSLIVKAPQIRNL
jgi:predicted MFS family arabinose efflux permease